MIYMKIELLAPAGSYQAMKAVFKAGADAVYIGGEQFGARAYADNLSTAEMLEAIDYAHLRGKKLYLTVNTLLKNKELEAELFQYLQPFYEQGLDAVIVQDLGVLNYIKEHFSDLPIHTSTQMTITGADSVALLKQCGAERIVMPRELSLQEISDIKQQTDIEIEAFVHGALCYSYSGQCLFSSFLGGRSGNRGRCAGPCRLPYSLFLNNQKLNNREEQYLLSPKDICTIELLPEIIAAGVTSLKIEGRMKRPEYAAGVVRIYRKYLDVLLKGTDNYKVAKSDYQELLDLYNRDGFSQGYYRTQNGAQMMAMKNEKMDANGKAVISQRNEALFVKLKQDYIEKEEPLAVTAKAILRLNEPLVLVLTYQDTTVIMKGDIIQAAQKQPMSQERVGQQLNKTGGTPFYFAELEVDIKGDIFVAIKPLNELRREALKQLAEQLCSVFRRNKTVLPSFNEKVEKCERLSESPCLTAQVETYEQLEILYQIPAISTIYASCNIFMKGDFKSNVKKYIDKMNRLNKRAYLALPYVLRDNMDLTIFSCFASLVEVGLGGFLTRNIEGCAKLKAMGLTQYIELDYQVYTMNDYASSFWHKQGVFYDTISPELNYYELRKRDNSKSEMIIYGYAPMMISAQCLKKNVDKCTKDFATLELTDRFHKKFKVKCDCDFCYNVIYNSIALGLIKESDKVNSLNVRSLRLAFSTESAKETQTIAKQFVAVYRDAAKMTPQQIFTKGHFKRGIE